MVLTRQARSENEFAIRLLSDDETVEVAGCVRHIPHKLAIRPIKPAGRPLDLER